LSVGAFITHKTYSNKQTNEQHKVNQTNSDKQQTQTKVFINYINYLLIIFIKSENEITQHIKHSKQNEIRKTSKYHSEQTISNNIKQTNNALQFDNRQNKLKQQTQTNKQTTRKVQSHNAE
jgi:hypothetical protein